MESEGIAKRSVVRKWIRTLSRRRGRVTRAELYWPPVENSLDWTGASFGAIKVSGIDSAATRLACCCCCCCFVATLDGRPNSRASLRVVRSINVRTVEGQSRAVNAYRRRHLLALLAARSSPIPLCFYGGQHPNCYRTIISLMLTRLLRAFTATGSYRFGFAFSYLLVL